MVKFHFDPETTNRELVLITGQLPVLPKHYWEGRDFSKSSLEPPLGSGAYKIKKFEAGKYIIYERVKNHWAEELPVHLGMNNFDEVHYDYYRMPPLPWKHSRPVSMISARRIIQNCGQPPTPGNPSIRNSSSVMKFPMNFQGACRDLPSTPAKPFSRTEKLERHSVMLLILNGQIKRYFLTLILERKATFQIQSWRLKVFQIPLS